MHRVLGELFEVVDGVHQHHAVLLQRLRRLGDVQELGGALRLAVPDVVAQDVAVSDP